MELDPNVVFTGIIGSFTAMFIATIGWMLKREYDFGVMQGNQKAGHKRMDRIEKKINGVDVAEEGEDE